MRTIYPLKTILFSFIACGLFVSCRQAGNHTGGKILNIDLDLIAAPREPLRLSEIARTISYVQMATTPDCLFTPSQYIIRGDHIFARDRDNGKVFLFNGDGKFVRQIGSIGAGPGEHLGCNYMQVSSRGDKVYMLSKKSNVLSCFSIEGNKLFSYPIKYSASWWFAPLSNDQQIFIAPFGYPVPDSASFLYYLQDCKGKVIRKYHSPRNIPVTGVIEFGSFYTNPQITLSYQPFCDTIFSISEKGDFLPRYVLNFGNSRIPNELWDDKQKFTEKRYDYYNGISLIETKNSVFIRFYYQKRSRIGIISLMDNKIRGIQSEKGFLENDLDGGPDFWPVETNGLDVVYSFIQPFDLVQQWQTGGLKNKKFSNQAERDKFVKMVTSLKEDDNPVVMMAELK
ncbi:MAG: 6-bladed beta-propeller [Bacteroidia bacterium]|nr:6-bladed beta-propeller [Bacteroidia bacterium]